MSRNYRYGESWNDLHTESPARLNIECCVIFRPVHNI